MFSFGFPIVIYSVEVAAIIPYFLIFLGWDRAILPVLSQSVVLLILSQLPKRFIWRYRPYMVNRAKMVISVYFSIFQYTNHVLYIIILVYCVV